MRYAIFIAAAAFIAYATVLNAPFTGLDDILYVLRNPRVHAPDGLLSLWDPRPAYRGEFVEYFPLRDTVSWIVWQCFGESSTAYHVTVVVAHAVTSILVFVLARRLGLPQATALFAGLLFSVHTSHLESVAYVSGLKDPLYTSFMLGAVAAYARFLETKTRRAYAAAIGLMIASLLCKSLAFVTPLLFLLLELLMRPAHTSAAAFARGACARLALPSAVAAAFLAQFLVIGRANHVITGPWGDTWANHFILVLWIQAKYVLHAVAPADFRLFYCFSYEPPLMYARLVGGLVAIAGYVAALTVSFRRSRLAFFLIAWFPICLLPVSNIVPFPALFADRYVYASSVAICIGGAVLLMKAPARMRFPLAAVVIVVLAGVTALRAALFHDEAGLWRAVLEDPVCEEQGFAYINLGDALLRQGKPRDALDAYHRAFNNRHYPTYNAVCGAHVRATFAALAIDELPLAERHAAAAEKLCSDGRGAPDALRAVAERRGDRARALAAAEKMVEVNAVPAAVWERGIARLHSGLVDAAIDDLVTAAAADPVVLCPRMRALLASPESAPARERLLRSDVCDKD